MMPAPLRKASVVCVPSLPPILFPCMPPVLPLPCLCHTALPYLHASEHPPVLHSSLWSSAPVAMLPTPTTRRPGPSLPGPNNHDQAPPSPLRPSAPLPLPAPGCQDAIDALEDGEATAGFQNKAGDWEGCLRSAQTMGDDCDGLRYQVRPPCMPHVRYQVRPPCMSHVRYQVRSPCLVPSEAPEPGHVPARGRPIATRAARRAGRAEHRTTGQ